MATLKINGKTVRISKFQNRALAHSYAGRGSKRHWVVMGTAGQYWVCTPRDAARLMDAGYELDTVK